MPVVDGLVAGAAGYEGFPAHPGHEVRPSGLWPSCPGEVGEFADLVDFHVGPHHVDEFLLEVAIIREFEGSR